MTNSMGQAPPKSFSALLTEPKHYFCFKSPSPIQCDGILDELAWSQASWSDYFFDIEGDSKPIPYHRTHVKMTWDNAALYVAAELEEENIWAYLTNYDDIVYHENDFEIFISNTPVAQHYYEIEVNAVKTIFDLFLPKAYRDGGRAQIEWNLKGLETGIYLDGTLNNGNDKDKRWIVEMKLPFASLSLNGKGVAPKPAEIWRINFSRVEYDVNFTDGKYQKNMDPNSGKTLPERNWVWSPQGVINMHYPERWGYLVFLDGNPDGKSTPVFTFSLEEKIKQQLWYIFYLQKDFFITNKKYASTLSELGITNTNLDIDGITNQRLLQGSSNTFLATIRCKAKNINMTLNETGLIQKIK